MNVMVTTSVDSTGTRNIGIGMPGPEESALFAEPATRVSLNFDRVSKRIR